MLNDEIEVEKTNLKMLELCQECGRVYYKALIFTCSHCGGKLIEADYRIAEVVIKLIDLGFKVSWSYLGYHNNLNEQGPGTQICIYFDDKYPASVFGDLPPEWYLSEYYIQEEENGQEIGFSALVCECYHDDNVLDDKNMNFDIKVTTSNMVTWLNDKDPEGNRAFLILSGCRLGAIVYLKEMMK